MTTKADLGHPADCACGSCRLFDLDPQHPGLGRTPKARARAARLILVMRRRFPHAPEGRVCGECAHLSGLTFAGTYYKCGVYGATRSEATDWRKSWPACGAFEEHHGIR